MSLPAIGSDRPLVFPIPREEWCCPDLREFCLCYNPRDDAVQRSLYRQLGRLVKLEVLGIGCGKPSIPMIQIDMTLDRGMLAELYDLKQLRHLFLMTELWSEMQQFEVEFMDRNWPCLEKVTFGFKREPLADIVRQPHWQWLKKQRPWIRFTYWSDSSSSIAMNS